MVSYVISMDLTAGKFIVLALRINFIFQEFFENIKILCGLKSEIHHSCGASEKVGA